MTVLFSVNTEKVRLRRESFAEVYGRMRSSRGCSRRWESRARRGWALPPGEAPGTPKSDSVHPDGMCLRGRTGSGGASPGWEGN